MILPGTEKVNIRNKTLKAIKKCAKKDWDIHSKPMFPMINIQELLRKNMYSDQKVSVKKRNLRKQIK